MPDKSYGKTISPMLGLIFGLLLLILGTFFNFAIFAGLGILILTISAAPFVIAKLLFWWRHPSSPSTCFIIL